MHYARHAAALLLALALAGPVAAFDVGPAPALQVDGSAAEWPSDAFRVAILGAPAGASLPPSDIDARFSLGWRPDALCILLTVTDDELLNAGAPRDNGDTVEILLARPEGNGQPLHLQLAGLASPDTLTSAFLNPAGQEQPDLPALRLALSRTDTGYTLEAEIPWPEPVSANATWGFQCFVNDVDSAGPAQRVAWYPAEDTATNPASAFPITLAETPGPPFTTWARGFYDDWARTRIELRAPLDHTGAKVTLGIQGEPLTAVLGTDNGVATATAHFPLPARGETQPRLEIASGASSYGLPLPNPDQHRARLAMLLPLQFQPPVFSSEKFPPCDFENPLLAEAVLGRYTVATRFFDAALAEVTGAAQPGRYGAVVTITPENGRPLTRYRTLFRSPRPLNDFYWNFTPPQSAASTLPATAYGGPEGAYPPQGATARYLHELLATETATSHDTAALLAALYETQDGLAHADAAENARTRDRQWWVDLKRRLHAGEASPTPALTCPRPLEGPPAPVLRPGSAAEAGMRDGITAALDTHLAAWAADTDEPFAVAVARDGVLFYHNAYGTRNGAPMTVDTPSWMASITKFLSATLMMQLVDQGLVRLDDPVADYLPAFRDAPVAAPLRIRDLYVHTNGLALGIKLPGHYPDHWGDEMHDLEEAVSGYYPYLRIREAHGYNGVGYALGGKIIEMISGEALPVYFQRHLLDPLGMDHTHAEDASAMSKSTPSDMAAFGQMMLNGGAYGPWRFFAPETLDQMLPKPLRETTGIDSDKDWGIGCTWFPQYGLSDKTFAHGAASAATLRIDPVNKLVVVMTRNAAGTNYLTYLPRFLEIIAEHLPEVADPAPL